jgi:hypothetical protein
LGRHSQGGTRSRSAGDAAPNVSIAIQDVVANPDFIKGTAQAWKLTSQTMSASEGSTKSVTTDENPGQQTFFNALKNGTIWIMVSQRFSVRIDTKRLEPNELEEWAKRVDLKKLAAIK